MVDRFEIWWRNVGQFTRMEQGQESADYALEKVIARRAWMASRSAAPALAGGAAPAQAPTTGPIDANALEAMAQQRPGEMFLKGSPILGTSRYGSIAIHAELCALGDAQESDFNDLPPGTPRALFLRPDGRPLMLIGLTKEECREMAASLFGQVQIVVTP